MLNTIIKTICLYSLILICSASERNSGVVILSLTEALDLAHKNLPGSISGNHDYYVKSAYYNWIYNHNRFKIFSEKKVLFKDFKAISDLYFKSGDINLLNKSLAEIEFYKVEAQYSDAQHDLLISGNKLKKLLYISNDILPENDSLEKYYLPDNTPGESMQDSIFDSYNDFKAQNDYLNLVFLLKKYNNQLIYYGKIMSGVQQLIATAILRYDNEDIEYFHYINIISNAIDLKLEYLKALDLYNQTALKVEIYNY